MSWVLEIRKMMERNYLILLIFEVHFLEVIIASGGSRDAQIIVSNCCGGIRVSGSIFFHIRRKQMKAIAIILSLCPVELESNIATSQRPSYMLLSRLSPMQSRSKMGPRSKRDYCRSARDKQSTNLQPCHRTPHLLSLTLPALYVSVTPKSRQTSCHTKKSM